MNDISTAAQTTYWVVLSPQLQGFVRPLAVDATTAGSTDAEIPFSIPRDQLYYWTRTWRDGVRIAREALDRGDFREFDSNDPNDVAHWLYSVDADE